VGKKTKVVIDTNVSASSIIAINESINIIIDDPPDNRVLDCAVSAGADFIISGDKHLLNLQNFKWIEILSPEDFLLRPR